MGYKFLIAPPLATLLYLRTERVINPWLNRRLCRIYLRNGADLCKVYNGHHLISEPPVRIILHSPGLTSSFTSDFDRRQDLIVNMF